MTRADCPSVQVCPVVCGGFLYIIAHNFLIPSPIESTLGWILGFEAMPDRLVTSEKHHGASLSFGSGL